MTYTLPINTAILDKPALPSRKTLEDKAIEEKSKEFESVFIAESLKQAKIGMPKDPLLESSLITDTFDSFMTRAFADGIVSQGGFGLATHIESALKAYQKT